MIRADRQDAAFKVGILLLSIIAVVVMLLEWYYEAAVIGIFAIFGWLSVKKVETRPKQAVAAVALVGLASTVGINRLVTHELVVENQTGGVISHLFVTGSTTPSSDFALHVENFSNGKRHTVALRSLLFDGELQIQVSLPDGSYFDDTTWGLQEKYRGRSHVIIRQDGEIEVTRE